jgi:nucleotide-binding universal stress UspA family protein
MFSTVVLPLDESEQGHRAIEPAGVTAQELGADLEVIHAVPPLLAPHAPATGEKFREALASRDVSASVDILADEDGVGLITRWVAARPSPLVVMATVSGGTGRDVLLGSTAERLVHQLAAPILLVGPDVVEQSLSRGKPIIIAIGGEDLTDESCELVRGWSTLWEATPWVVTVTPAMTQDDGPGASAVTRVAKSIGSTAQWEVLHGDDPAAAIATFARQLEAGSIVATTHGREGMDRLVAGSTSFAVTHQAPCPVLVHQPFNVVFHAEPN